MVKRKWTSEAGLDSDREGMVVGGCGGGGSEVEAGEDWVRPRGWWGQIIDDTLPGSSWRVGLRITCLCGSQDSWWRGEQGMKEQLSTAAHGKD